MPKYQIRQGVFETNSSSSHSLVIKNEKDTVYTLDEILKEVDYNTKTGVYTITKTCDFGRFPCHLITTFEEKVRYVLGNIIDWEDVTEENTKPVTNVLKEILPDFEKLAVETDYIGTDDNKLMRWLKKENVSLKDFLLDRRYIVVCDGDEYCKWHELKKTGIIKTDKFKELS